MIRNINKSSSRQASPGNEANEMTMTTPTIMLMLKIMAGDDEVRVQFFAHTRGRSALWHRRYCQEAGFLCVFRCLLLNTHSAYCVGGGPPLTPPCAEYKQTNMHGTHMSRRSVTYFISVFMCVYKVLIFISLCQTLLNNFSDRETRDLESNIANGSVYTFVRTVYMPYDDDGNKEEGTNRVESSDSKFLILL